MTQVKSRTSLEVDYGRSIGFVAGGMGDQIYHLTQLRALAGACANGQIDIACIHPGPIATMLAHTKWVGNIIDARPLRRYLPGIRGTETVASLRNINYDTAFFLHKSTSFKLAARAAKIPHRIGLGGHWLDQLLLHHRLPLDGGGQRRDLWGHRPFIAAIDEYILNNGMVLDNETPTIQPSPDATGKAAALLADMPRPITIVNMFALDAARRWPVDNAIDVIATLAARHGGTFLLNAGPDARDWHDAALAAWQVRIKADRNLKAHQLQDCLKLNPSMEKDVALYQAADFYVGVDSFTANLALNSNLPAVILFARPADVLAYRSRTVALPAPTDGQIGSITVAMIEQAFERLRKDT